MKGPRLIAAILLLSIALVCFISTPVFSGGDPWDVDGDSGGGSGSDSDSTVVPDGIDPFDEGTDQIGGGYSLDWLSGLAFQWTSQVITYVLGNDAWSPDPKRVVVDKSSGNVVGH